MSVLPIPEVTYGEGYEVREAEGEHAYVDFVNREFVVPFGNSPRESFIRAHENGHHITPQNWIEVASNVENRTLQALEDCRVNGYLRRIGIDTSPPPAGQIAGLRPFESDIDACRSLVSVSGRFEETMCREEIRNMPNGAKIESTADDIIARLAPGHSVEFSETIAAAGFLHSIFEEKKTPDPGDGAPGNDQGQGESGQGGQEGSQEGSQAPVSGQDSPEDGSGDQDGLGSSQGDGSQEGQQQGQDNGQGQQPTTARDGKEIIAPFEVGGGDAPLSKLPPLTAKERAELEEMNMERLDDLARQTFLGDPIPAEVRHPKLSKPMPRKRALGKRPDETGSFPRYMHRFATDGRIFANQRMAKDAVAVLIDVSGSMQLRVENIQDILNEVPASIVAMYSARHADSHGSLTIIAHNGRIIGDNDDLYELMSKSGRQNLCDVGAIEWLAKRKEQRKLWVSDGLVTGKHKDSVALLKPKWLRRIARLMKAKGIVRVHSLEDLKKFRGQLMDVKAPVTYLPPKRLQGGKLVSRTTGREVYGGDVK